MKAYNSNFGVNWCPDDPGSSVDHTCSFSFSEYEPNFIQFDHLTAGSDTV